jgi:hypothetical protein
LTKTSGLSFNFQKADEFEDPDEPEPRPSQWHCFVLLLWYAIFKSMMCIRFFHCSVHKLRWFIILQRFWSARFMVYEAPYTHTHTHTHTRTHARTHTHTHTHNLRGYRG